MCHFIQTWDSTGIKNKTKRENNASEVPVHETPSLIATMVSILSTS
jgi:hypothetical protein